MDPNLFLEETQSTWQTVFLVDSPWAFLAQEQILKVPRDQG